MKILYQIALWVMCAAYLYRGLTGLFDFTDAVSEMAQAGLEPAEIFASLAMISQLGGAFLVLSGHYRWLGALWLGVFTLAASLVNDGFWNAATGERLHMTQSFFDHLGLVGGFMLVAWQDAFRPRLATDPEDEAFLEAAALRMQPHDENGYSES